jgi:hypothetical protein
VELRQAADCQRVIDRYTALEAAMVDRFGTGSQAAAAVHYTLLVELWAARVHPAAEPFWRRAVGRLHASCQRRLWEGFRNEPRDHVRVLDPVRPLLGYGGTPQAPPPDLRRVVLDAEALSAVPAGEHVIYVVDEDERLVVRPVPVPVRDLFFPARQADRARVTHPMLVPGRPVQAAGELCLVGTGRVERVLVNTRSGHFMPPAHSLDVVTRVCRRLFGLPDHDVLGLSIAPVTVSA